MADFTPITTQEQLNALIGDRIQRERETLSKKYGDYDDLKTKVSTYEKQIEDYSKQLKDATDKIAKHDKEIADRDTKIKAYEQHSVKTRIAHETGLSYEAIDFLKGEDEDSIKKSAEALKALVGGSKREPPHKEPEQGSSDPKRAAALALLNKIKTKE